MKQHRMKTAQSGFTLVEVAIVMVIIGLLLGATMKGQEIIKQGKVHNAAQMFEQVFAANQLHLDRNSKIPGDNDGDGLPDTDSDFWYDLYRSGYLVGIENPGATNPVIGPKNPYGVSMRAAGDNVVWVCSNIPETAAVRIEKRKDDNNGLTGSYIFMRTTPALGTNPKDNALPLPVDPADDLAWVCRRI